MTDESFWVERFYTHYLGRDLTYLFAGGLFISIAEYAWFNTIFLPKQFSLELIGFLLASYFFGIMLRGFVVLLHPPLEYHLLYYFPSNYNCRSELCLAQDLLENFDAKVLNQRERYFYLSAIYLSIGSSFFLGGVLMIVVAFGRFIFNAVLPSWNYILLIICFVPSAVFMLLRSKFWLNKIRDEDKSLVQYMDSKKQ